MQFVQFAHRVLSGAIESELKASAKVVEDQNVSIATKIGLLSVSRPEKLLTDAIAEKRAQVVIENIAEAITNSPRKIDTELLRSYASSRGVTDQVFRELDLAKESRFP